MIIETSHPELNEHANPPSAPETASHRAKQDDDISILDMLINIAERKRIIAWITSGFAIVAIVISLVLPQSYTAAVTLLPPQQNSSVGGALASQLSSLGGVAALAGGSFSLRNANEMYVAMLKSRVVEDAMVQRFGLMQEYGKRYSSDARRALERHADVNGSGKDGLIHIAIEDRDPRRAAELANGYIEEFRKLSQHLAITEASQRRL